MECMLYYLCTRGAQVEFPHNGACRPYASRAFHSSGTWDLQVYLHIPHPVLLCEPAYHPHLPAVILLSIGPYAVHVRCISDLLQSLPKRSGTRLLPSLSEQLLDVWKILRP